MQEKPPNESWIVDVDSLPKLFPTHRHPSYFWETLGRTIATYGFLEEVLAKAIFSFTAAQPIEDAKFDEQFNKWILRLEKALTDPLGQLIQEFGKVVRAHPNSSFQDLDCLLDDLRRASRIRNVLCHGSWNRCPDADGASVPYFVDSKKRIFETAINSQYLDQTQRHVAQLACSVMNSVTSMGWAFPGTEGPGRAL